MRTNNNPPFYGFHFINQNPQLQQYQVIPQYSTLCIPPIGYQQPIGAQQNQYFAANINGQSYMPQQAQHQIGIQKPKMNKSNINGNNQSAKNNNKPSDDLRTSIQVFVKTLESAPENTQAISTLSSRFSIKRRRLYDVINVFEAIGCCAKSGLDSVKWVGRDNIIKTLKTLKEQRNIHRTTDKLVDLFSVPCCVGISNLTISFLLFFFALGQNHIDLRYVSQFFSRDTTRYKTTLCKLYQICYILGSIGVTTRTTQVCEIILNHPYYDEETIPDEESFGVLVNENCNGKNKLNKNKTTKKYLTNNIYNNNNLVNASLQQQNCINNCTNNNNVHDVDDDMSPPLSIGALLNHQEDIRNDRNKIIKDRITSVYERRRELKQCFDEFNQKEEEQDPGDFN